ncbi:uncharacterized protein LOC128883038 [Hylaeus volcanicus]|uniref:uncharacterized protein LOC128883038 n=1 Tax=Hylaeus volcanicus TaxID=313075 RepID=UPI0023B81CAF|nr:uncharacterized protein LOC128883038 [Hylaeus volcanicus]
MKNANETIQKIMDHQASKVPPNHLMRKTNEYEKSHSLIKTTTCHEWGIQAEVTQFVWPFNSFTICILFFASCIPTLVILLIPILLFFFLFLFCLLPLLCYLVLPYIGHWVTEMLTDSFSHKTYEKSSKDSMTQASLVEPHVSLKYHPKSFFSFLDIPLQHMFDGEFWKILLFQYMMVFKEPFTIMFLLTTIPLVSALFIPLFFITATLFLFSFPLLFLLPFFLVCALPLAVTSTFTLLPLLLYTTPKSYYIMLYHNFKISVNKAFTSVKRQFPTSLSY